MQTLKSSFLVYACLLAALSSCGGGGGGGGEFSDEAELSVSLSKHKIDSGDTLQATIRVDNVSDTGLMLKIRADSALTFVDRSAELEAGKVSQTVTPEFNGVKDESRYIVFFFSPSDFGRDKSGVLTLELRGAGKTADGQVAVDADANDPLIADGVEFKASNPHFTPQDAERIEVMD